MTASPSARAGKSVTRFDVLCGPSRSSRSSRLQRDARWHPCCQTGSAPSSPLDGGPEESD